jgi:hypothetical protein
LRDGVGHRIDKVFDAISMAVGFYTAAGGQSLPASFCRVQEASSNGAGNKGLGGIERRNRSSAMRQLSGADAAFVLRKGKPGL